MIRAGIVALGVLCSCAVLVGAGAPSASAAQGYAPVGRAGPELTVPKDVLARSIRCRGDVAGADREPVLLLPATTVNSRQNYAFNYERLLRDRGVPYCTSDSPDDPQNMGDMQVRAQFVTYAIRHMHRLAGRRIAVLGHSQGGMIMRWSLRFWPDTRAMVDDVIGVAGTNHGSAVVNGMCAATCAPALWQQRAGSAFVDALNSRQETFPGISYTEVYSRTDELVQPNLNDQGTSSLHGGGGRITNVAVQDICPLDSAEHLSIGTLDPVASALVTDALDHDGPAKPSRIDRGVCGQLVMPGTNVVGGATGLARSSTVVLEQLALAPHSMHEPALACYVHDECETKRR